MLQEKEALITKRPKDEIDGLYQIVMNQKFFDRTEGVSTEDELEKLDKWMEEMQSCYRESTRIENYTGKQAQIIKEISEQLRKKDEKEINDFLGRE